MKISKNKKACAAKETNTVTDVKSKYQDTIDYIKAAIDSLGNIAQIDTPYLTEGSSGLTYVVDRFKGWEHSGHVTLQRGERSRLADFASESL